MRNITDKSCRENQDIHFIFNNFFKKLYHLWDNVEKYGRDRAATDDSIIQSMRLEFWITKATDTHLDYVVLPSWIVMAHAQTPDLVFRRNGRVHLNQCRHQFSRLLAAEVCASAVVMLDTPYSKVVGRVLATYSIRQFPLHFPSGASPCAITFQLESTYCYSTATMISRMHLNVMFIVQCLFFVPLCDLYQWLNHVKFSWDSV